MCLTTNLNDVIWDDVNNPFVAAGDNGVLLISPDGTTRIQQSSTTTINFKIVAVND